jgi:hypothetical protein
VRSVVHAPVVDHPGLTARLRQHFGGVLGVADRLVAEAVPARLTISPPCITTAQVSRIACGTASEPWPW